ncbi:hypothetical protein C8F04DRAFT_1190942 [Mycena alexandri]|uniref:Endonuclease/exonuclease/phosphatase domain-containing protein n=1 Tax=Mycena alexandri TaxID=1745969 RepID=A0AAD6SF15_9AGAR|nr:hypothetical protein C8F04DRAFT_1190942 [Mycena alexandri]
MSSPKRMHGVRRGTANTGTDPQGLASLGGSPQLAMNTNNNNNILTSLGTWTQANGQNWASTSGEGTGPAVSHALDDGVCVFGDRNTLHGQREPGEIHATARGTPGEEPRPSASGPVRNQIPVAQAGNAQSGLMLQSATLSYQREARKMRGSQIIGSRGVPLDGTPWYIGHVPENIAPPNNNKDDDEGNNPTPREANRRQRRASACASKKNTKAAIQVALLNIKGWKARDAPQLKWYEVNQMMREKRIGVLLVQEAHLNDEHRENIEQLFKKTLKKILPARGVAIVLNKQLPNVNGAKTTEIIPGRALLIQTNWHRGEKIKVLGVYAPNDPMENAKFWKDIEDFFDTHLTLKPDVVGGDCNMVEDVIDHLPMHEDQFSQVEALDNLKSKLSLKDGWRDTHPTTKAYTFHQVVTGSIRKNSPQGI